MPSFDVPDQLYSRIKGKRVYFTNRKTEIPRDADYWVQIRDGTTGPVVCCGDRILQELEKKKNPVLCLLV